MSHILSREHARPDDSDFIVAAARAFYVDDWANACESRGESFSGCELTEVAPATSPEAFELARAFAAKLGDAPSAWAASADESGNREPTEENLGWYAAMQAMGHGVGLECGGPVMSGHTPGPWSRNIPPATKYTTVWSGRNKHVAHVVTRSLAPEEVEANICLIAAAPDLLAACRIALERLDLNDGEGEEGEFIDQLRAAIAKAEGRAP